MVPAIPDNGRPAGTDRGWRRGEGCKLSRAINDFAAHHRQHRLQTLDFLRWDGEVVSGKHSEVRKLPCGNRPFHAILTGEPCASDGVQSQRLHPVKAVRLRVKRHATDCFAAHQPVERNPWIVTCHSRPVRLGSDRNAHLDHFPYRRRALGRPRAVAVDKVFTLKCHPVLNCDAALQCPDSLDVTVGNRLGVIEEPSKAF